MDIENPPENALPKEWDLDALTEAVTKSGYPLQTVIGQRLTELGYLLEEEWAYVDNDEGTERRLDISAVRPLQEEEHVQGGRRLETALALNVECKQSRVPLIAMEAVAPPDAHSFPTVVGFPVSVINVSPREAGHEWIQVSLLQALGLTRHDFSRTAPVASLLTGPQGPKTSKIVLSGDTAYNSLVLPLVKAVRHYAAVYQGGRAPSDSGGWWRARLTVPVAVVDAPLLLARPPGSSSTLEPVPWARLVYRAAQRAEEAPEHTWPTMVDVVHRHFFETYLSDHLEPFADEFRDRINRKLDILVRGAATLPGLDLQEDYPYDALDLLEP